MNRSAINSKKLMFILCSFTSISCLVGSFGGNLASYQIYSQKQKTVLGIEYDKKFILTEFDKDNNVFGFNKAIAKLEHEQLSNNLLMKFSLLGSSIFIAAMLLTFGDDLLDDIEIKAETAEVTKQARKEMLLSKVKHKFAMASKAQQALFLQELQALVDLNAELDSTYEMADDALESKFVAAAYHMQDGYDMDTAVAMAWEVDRGSEEHKQVLSKFEQWYLQSSDAE